MDLSCFDILIFRRDVLMDGATTGGSEVRLFV